MDIFLIQLLNGLDKGAAYALIALGLTLTFGTLGIVNFAHGALFMLGAFCAVSVQKILTISKKIKDESITGKNEWFYELTGASGFQYIENNKMQRTYRIQTKLGYKFSERSLLTLYGSKSNIASATAAGFTFTEIGLRFKWFMLNRPFFRKK